jgi:hypothetical protein
MYSGFASWLIAVGLSSSLSLFVRDRGDLKTLGYRVDVKWAVDLDVGRGVSGASPALDVELELELELVLVLGLDLNSSSS